ncbi:hypothetical protein BOFE_10410 (plasmid) [Candidatus Borrelia fainii]|uniref:Uncharacterized protein n=1 Tax=Candidatus Borrelia fainii TaxID=2518322 RepID=A0ABM8DLX6_9SPIR|nr:hypothetical protein BOFE_10410 [Candidatus Borrelia fainii]
MYSFFDEPICVFFFGKGFEEKKIKSYFLVSNEGKSFIGKFCIDILMFGLCFILNRNLVRY